MAKRFSPRLSEKLEHQIITRFLAGLDVEYAGGGANIWASTPISTNFPYTNIAAGKQTTLDLKERRTGFEPNSNFGKIMFFHTGSLSRICSRPNEVQDPFADPARWV